MSISVLTTVARALPHDNGHCREWTFVWTLALRGSGHSAFPGLCAQVTGRHCLGWPWKPALFPQCAYGRVVSDVQCVINPPPPPCPIGTMAAGRQKHLPAALQLPGGRVQFMNMREFLWRVFKVLHKLPWMSLFNTPWKEVKDFTIGAEQSWNSMVTTQEIHECFRAEQRPAEPAKGSHFHKSSYLNRNLQGFQGMILYPLQSVTCSLLIL